MVSLKVNEPVKIPLLPTWLEIHTKAGLPENIPVPPRICKERSPLTSQLNPTRGEKRIFAPGSLEVLSFKGLFSASWKVNPLDYCVLFFQILAYRA